MGLQSALTTALTGMNAAETSIDVVGNNVANANTVGFKESNVNFATQFLQTQSIGSAPTDGRGGTNPRQVGLGVKVAEIAQDFNQGTIEISSNPLDLAIQGDGFFIVEGSQGEQLYTRNGQFKTNAENEIVTITGQRVLGYGVDADFNVQSTVLQPLQIPLGQSAVAQETQNVILTGGLDAEGTVGTISEVIQSGVLIDGSKEVPDSSSSTLTALTLPLESTTIASSATPGAVTPGTYSYRVTFVDNDGNESPASNVTASLVVAGAGGSIDLTNIPQPSGGSEFSTINVYRNNSAVNTDYELAGTVAAGTTTFSDGSADGSLGTTLDNTGLDSGAYSYYVTYYNSVSGEESRPTARIGPVTADGTNAPRIRLDNLPEPSTDPTTGGYDGVRIYRKLRNSESFHFVDSITPAEIAAASSGVSYIDNTPDAVIAANAEVDLEGPDISFGLPLVDVVSRQGSTYTNLFEEGELAFTGGKADRSLATRNLTITSTTTVQDLISFMEDSLGIVKTALEDSFPAGNYGGTISDSRIQFTSNLGVENALSIDLSAFQLTPASGGVADSVPIQFNSTVPGQSNGSGDSADVIVYDSLGSPIRVRVTTVLEERSGTSAKFRWVATSPDNQPELGVGTVVGTGVITTDGNGDVTAVSNNRVAVDRRDSPAASPLEFELDFSQVNGLAQDGNDSLNVSRQDGFPAGTLTSFSITESGSIEGVYSNGSSRTLGQVLMARFANNNGLEQIGDNLFAAGVNSGLPIQDVPSSQGIGSITSGAVELSNSDIGQNLIELILASTQYRGGARVITAVQELLDELLAISR
ncbi:flagellar hook-basal body complex protein [Adhaeretor mobilis]|uniref:Flagellar hook protein FlgE n=1 Tax=Adhaeretor mobilis TaxID=1930276 RepID=A0A517MYS9_9BACT|nr:flagellar hook-basal body complex protein [Adhaeretor mobilis]QDT00046.1 Flagellar hook protein FlgE [Adhaeretor mobilis]